jgi:hypothetical protein
MRQHPLCSDLTCKLSALIEHDLAPKHGTLSRGPSWDFTRSFARVVGAGYFVATTDLSDVAN